MIYMVGRNAIQGTLYCVENLKRTAKFYIKSTKFFFFFLKIYIYIQCHHMSFVDFVVLPPGHGRSVTDF